MQLGRVQAEHDIGAAAAALQTLVQTDPGDAARQAANAVLDLTLRRSPPSLRAQLEAACALPAVFDSREQILTWRSRYTEALARLDAEWQTTMLANSGAQLHALARSNFLLAYHGEDDLDLQCRFAALIERATAILQPELHAPPAWPGRSRRIGLISSFWRRCTVGSYFACWVDWLRQAGYRVHLYQLGPRRDDLTDRLAAGADVFHYVETSLEELAQHIRSERLDLLIYPELGMDARMIPLAALRLARRQVVAWGHPVTSGFTTIDGYLSCAEMEPDDAAAHYREPLYLLPGLGVEYLRPSIPPPVDFDWPARPRVLVPQATFKLHPDGDTVMADIAARCPNVEFVLFEAEQPRWVEQFRHRLTRCFAERGLPAPTLRILPLGSRERYLQVNQACDLMLDSLHWSGGNTALDALQCGLPIVTCPGRFMRGRQSLAMLRRLRLEPALVADTPQAQAERAVSLLHDRAERQSLRSLIARGLDSLFDATAARERLLAHVGALCN